MTAGENVTVTVTVAVDVEAAFEVFTQEIDRWWRRGPRYRIGGRSPGVLHFEPGVGGRLFESAGDEPGAPLVELGRVTVWEPPARLAFEWRGVNFAPGEKTLVEVTFEPIASGTRVQVRHGGWDAIQPDHPARHGHVGPAFGRMMGLWWGDLMASLREHAATRG